MKKNVKTNFMKFWLLITLMISTMFAAALTASADEDDVKPTKIKAVKASITTTVGKEFQLKVRTTPRDADEDFLRWKITSGKNIIRFDDDDRYDDEIEFKAKKAGTAKVTCTIKGTKKKVTFTVKVKKAPKVAKKISIIGKKTRTVEVGDDFELKIKKYSGLKERNLQWKIKNTKIVAFDDYDRTDDEVEFRARKIGTTTITCTNKATKQKVTFTIHVIADRDYDDDWDDDDDDDDDWDD